MSLGHSEYTLMHMAFELCIYARGYLRFKDDESKEQLSDIELNKNFIGNYHCEIELRMIKAAILYRRLNDQFNQVIKNKEWTLDAYNENYVPSKFGYNITTKKPVESLRDVSNKIIHSDIMWCYLGGKPEDLLLSETGYFSNEQLQTVFYAKGSFKGKEWTVAFDLLAFGEDLYSVADVYANYYVI